MQEKNDKNYKIKISSFSTISSINKFDQSNYEVQVIKNEIKEMRINPWHAEYFYVLTFLPNFYPVNLQHSSCKHAFLIEWKRCGS